MVYVVGQELIENRPYDLTDKYVRSYRSGVRYPTTEKDTMPMTASSLRQNIYRILDQIIETGIPVEIHRRGKRLRISAVDPVDKLANLNAREFLVGDPEALVHLDWSAEWSAEFPQPVES